MGRFMIVSRLKKLQEYIEIAKEYDVSFEINDFYEPEILDDEDRQRAVIEAYHKNGIPAESTLHGAFCDIVVFSHDERIREISKMRMEQSIQFAKALGLQGVIFHTNYNPDIKTEEYTKHFIDVTADYLTTLLERNPDINIFIENMFDKTPYALKELSQRLDKYENYGVCLDWSHGILYGSGIREWVECLKPYVKHIHINDNDFESDLHLPVGSGKIDWNQFWEYYNTYFSHCSVLIETNEPDNQRKSLEFIKTLKRKVTVYIVGSFAEGKLQTACGDFGGGGVVIEIVETAADLILLLLLNQADQLFIGVVLGQNFRRRAGIPKIAPVQTQPQRGTIAPNQTSGKAGTQGNGFVPAGYGFLEIEIVFFRWHKGTHKNTPYRRFLSTNGKNLR